jgi:tetratricopeptide (TPR) repeat protein
MRLGELRHRPHRWVPAWARSLIVSFCLACGVPGLIAADAEDARAELLRGNYEKAISLAKDGLEDESRDEAWHEVLIHGLLAVGRYPEADEAMSDALRLVPRSVRLRWLAREAFSSHGRPEAGIEASTEIPRLVSQRPWSYRTPPDLLAVGRALLASGLDAKDVLDRVYATAKRADPDFREVYLASGELALEKSDFALAAKHFDEGLKRFPEDPDLLYGRARAFAGSDREEMGKALEAALNANPRHVPSLLLLADHRIDAEEYDSALQTLKKAREVNPAHPEAWAYEAVIAHLRSDDEGEAKARAAALQHWSTNPAVPHLIGRKLSQKYRFAEGAALQREALSFEPGFLPAKAQLASDLLRLGEEEAGWELIQEVHQRDAYDVTAYNLVTLFDTMSGFQTLTNEHFTVRMKAQEAEVYGARVLDLLERARATLAPKYGLNLTEPTVVEIFPDPKDFGVRTFGMPDNPGYLGVCFGRVITANSPAATRGNSVNWEAVLWHEFCHVVTLQLTANKMPRWLSEGISTYEERVADPAWGEQLTPKYRNMILEGEMTPIGRLSAAFLTPKSGLHLQFAYYESSLVVEFLVERFGLEKLRAILKDLREGVFINDAIERHTVSMERLEEDFANFARKRAESLAPGLDWKEPEAIDRGPFQRAAPEPVAQAPNNYWRLQQEAIRLMENRKWAEAKAPLQKILEHHPNDLGPDSAHALMARVHRELGETVEERVVLERWARVDAEATDAYLRLMELASETGDWKEVRRNVERYFAVNPLVAAPYRYLAQASEAQGELPVAIQQYRTLLRLDPPNPADVHYQLARLLHGSAHSPAEARLHLLQSLEDAPRNRAALELLLDLQETGTPTGRSP